MSIWHEDEPEALLSFTADLVQQFPALRVDVEGPDVLVRGPFQIRDEATNKVVDEFLIEVRVPHSFPTDLPRVWEVGGRIPRIMDRHVVPEGGYACIFAPEDRHRHFPPWSRLIDYFSGPAYSYFYSQSFFERHGDWPFEDRRHGVLGRLDCWYELLGTKDDRAVMRALGYLVKRGVKGHHPCYCGSGFVLRKCHGATLQDIRTNVSREIVGSFVVAFSIHLQGDATRATTRGASH